MAFEDILVTPGKEKRRQRRRRRRRAQAMTATHRRSPKAQRLGSNDGRPRLPQQGQEMRRLLHHRQRPPSSGQKSFSHQTSRKLACGRTDTMRTSLRDSSRPAIRTVSPSTGRIWQSGLCAKSTMEYVPARWLYSLEAVVNSSVETACIHSAQSWRHHP